MAPLCGSGMRWAHCKPGVSPRAIRPADNSPSRRHCLPLEGEPHVRTYSACLTVSVLLSPANCKIKFLVPGAKAPGTKNGITLPSPIWPNSSVCLYHSRPTGLAPWGPHWISMLGRSQFALRKSPLRSDFTRHPARLQRGCVNCILLYGYSTVTDLAKFLGLSISQPRCKAT